MKKSLIILAKKPELGKCKTRLAQGVGEALAHVVYQKLLSNTLSIAQNPAWETHVFWKGEGAYPLSAEFKVKEQVHGDLGLKMHRAFDTTLSESDAAVMIGTDCPDLTSDLLQQAFKTLENNDLVLGPSEDGGYYLIGMKRSMPFLFNEMEWSTAEVLENTLQRANKNTLKVVQLRSLNDIDTESDLRRSSWANWFEGIQKEI
jgi:rSAM/selenodomain-associated transferase 1